MKVLGSAFLVCMVSSNVVFGLLPPLYQTSDEIKSIFVDHNLGDYIPSGEPIVAIHKNENGYLILTNKHSLQAKVIYEPMSHPGPAKFRIEFEKAQGL